MTPASIAKRMLEFLSAIPSRDSCTQPFSLPCRSGPTSSRFPKEMKAIIGIGKRDASFDLGLPIPALRFRPGEQSPTAAPAHWKLTKMMDQHAYLQLAAGDDVRVGDMIAFDISHPCLTFDRWRTIPIINTQYQVTDVVQTFF